jgi:hypothetical protein
MTENKEITYMKNILLLDFMRSEACKMRNNVIDNISRHFSLFQFLNPFLRSIEIVLSRIRIEITV